MADNPPRVTTDQIRDARFWLKCAMRDFWVKTTDRGGNLEERYVEYLNHLGATADLSRRQKMIIALRLGAGLSVEDVAEMLVVSPATVAKDYRDACEHVAMVVNL